MRHSSTILLPVCKVLLLLSVSVGVTDALTCAQSRVTSVTGRNADRVLINQPDAIIQRDAAGLDMAFVYDQPAALCHTQHFCVREVTFSRANSVVWSTCAETYANETGQPLIDMYDTRCRGIQRLLPGANQLQCCREEDCCNVLVEQRAWCQGWTNAQANGASIHRTTTTIIIISLVLTITLVSACLAGA